MNKTPLALCPGLLCNHQLWRAQIDALSDVAECHVGRFDNHSSFEEMARSILDAMPERFALAGLSMGGYVSQAVMRIAPERVSHLALLDTSGRADTEEQKRRRRGLISLSKVGKFKGVTPKLLPMLIHEDRLEEEALTTVIFEMAEDIGKEAFFMQQEAIMARPDGREDLTKVECPTLILCGRQDTLTPLELHEEMAELTLNSELVVVEDSGHLPTLERPEAVNEAMRNWLAR